MHILRRSIYGVLGMAVLLCFQQAINQLIFSCSCVFAEMYKGKPILQGNSDMDQLMKIFQLCGSPNDKNMPGFEKLPGCDGFRQFSPYHRTLEGHYSE